MRRWQLWGAGAVVAAVVLAGCGGGGEEAGTSATTGRYGGATEETGTAGTSKQPTVAIEDFRFLSNPEVAPGTVLSVTNRDSVAHTLTADEGAFDTGSISGDGGEATFTAPEKPGRYPFHCEFHPFMKATLTVK